MACIDSTALMESKINKNINLTQTSIFQFLLCFDSSCDSYVELSEYSNEILFLLLEKQPQLVLKCMSRNKKKLPWDNICKKLQNPIHDNIPLNAILEKVLEIKKFETIRKDVINSLMLAIKKYN